MKKYFFLLALSASSIAYSDAGQRPEKPVGPWFTGPLLTPSAYTIPAGHANIEPYFFANRTIGKYLDDWSENSQGKSTTFVVQVPMQIGLTSFMDIQLSPSVSYANVQGHTGGGFNDLPVQVDFQIWTEHPHSAVPAVKVFLNEEFPTGKFQHLNQSKMGADATGGGSYVSTVGVSFAKLIKFRAPDFLRIRTTISYSIPSAVDVEGFNSYGGGFGTKGKVYPGRELAVLVGLEYTPTLHMAFALDILGTTATKTKFSGKHGALLPQAADLSDDELLPFDLAFVGSHSSESVSLAPAIEYNFTETLGLIGGAWFSVAGRNSSRFVNGVVAFNMYF